MNKIVFIREVINQLRKDQELKLSNKLEKIISNYLNRDGRKLLFIIMTSSTSSKIIEPLLEPPFSFEIANK